MKKLIPIFLCSISAYSYAEVNTKVYNNYIALSEPEYAPHSTLIKHQEILLDEKEPKKRIIISSNNNGFITFFDDRYIVGSYNYAEKTVDYILRNSENKQINYEMRLNGQNEITGIMPSKKLSDYTYLYISSYTSEYSYNSQDKKIKNKTKGVRGRTRYSEFFYNTDNLVQSINTVIYTKGENVTPVEKKEFIYDSQNRLIETRLDYFGITLCYFTNHNKHGDWTKGHCVNKNYNNENLGNMTRTIEYWE